MDKVFNYELLKDKRKIRICLCRPYDHTENSDGWQVTRYEKPGQILRNAENGYSQGVSILAKTLNKSKINEIQRFIDISNIKIYDHTKIKIDHAQSVLEWCKEFDVAFVVTRSMLKKTKTPLIISMLSLQKECTVISPCLSTKRPPAPVDFPCQMAIAVGSEETKSGRNIVEEDDITKGKKTIQDETKEQKSEEIPLLSKNRVNWQSCGTTLDFLCKDEDVQVTDPWLAAYYTTAIVALILVKAYALGE